MQPHDAPTGSGPSHSSPEPWWLVGRFLRLLLLLSAVAVVFVAWWHWPPTSQQRVNQLLKEWDGAPKKQEGAPAEYVSYYFYGGRHLAEIEKDIDSLGPEYVPAFCAALDGIGREPAIAMRILRELERQDDKRARDALIQCVRRGGEASKPALRLLLRWSQGGGESPPAELLVECVDRGNSVCRELAAMELVCRHRPRAAEPLIRWLDKAPEEALRIIVVLGHLNDRRATGSILPYLQHENQTIRRAAEAAVRSLEG